MQARLRAKKKETLERFLEESPAIYNPLNRSAYAMHGIYGGKKIASSEVFKVKQLAEAQKPYLDKHLDVMDQIKTRQYRK